MLLRWFIGVTWWEQLQHSSHRKIGNASIGASENALHVYNLFSGHAGDVDAPGDEDPGDNDADAVQQMIQQVEAIWSQLIHKLYLPISMMLD